MELTKEEMKKVIAWLDHYYDRIYGSHDSPMDLDTLPAIASKFKNYLNSGETKWLLQELEKTDLNYLFKNLGGYSMDSKTRNKILERCEILKYMGDDGISSIFDRLDDDDLMEECGWVLDHDDLDDYQYMGIVKGVVRKSSTKQSNDMWS